MDPRSHPTDDGFLEWRSRTGTTLPFTRVIAQGFPFDVPGVHTVRSDGTAQYPPSLAPRTVPGDGAEAIITRQPAILDNWTPFPWGPGIQAQASKIQGL